MSVFHAGQTCVEERVILVDAHDVPRGTAEKMHAHRAALRHRAFSVFVFDDAGRTLLQRRAPWKYHSGGLWANTCCGHPRPAELTGAAARRRLFEEMGVDCLVNEIFAFNYSAAFTNGLIEVEHDHVFLAAWSGDPEPDPLEVDAWRWREVRDVDDELQCAPDRYARWFALAWPRVRQMARVWRPSSVLLNGV